MNESAQALESQLKEINDEQEVLYAKDRTEGEKYLESTLKPRFEALIDNITKLNLDNEKKEELRKAWQDAIGALNYPMYDDYPNVISEAFKYRRIRVVDLSEALVDVETVLSKILAKEGNLETHNKHVEKYNAKHFIFKAQLAKSNDQHSALNKRQEGLEKQIIFNSLVDTTKLIDDYKNSLLEDDIKIMKGEIESYNLSLQNTNYGKEDVDKSIANVDKNRLEKFTFLNKVQNCDPNNVTQIEALDLTILRRLQSCRDSEVYKDGLEYDKQSGHKSIEENEKIYAQTKKCVMDLFNKEIVQDSMVQDSKSQFAGMAVNNEAHAATIFEWLSNAWGRLCTSFKSCLCGVSEEGSEIRTDNLQYTPLPHGNEVRQNNAGKADNVLLDRQNLSSMER